MEFRNFKAEFVHLQIFEGGISVLVQGFSFLFILKLVLLLIHSTGAKYGGVLMDNMILRARENDREKEELVRSFEPLIKKCIRIYVKDFGLHEDALQEGIITILKCIETYDINAGYPFAAYVKRAVSYSMRDFGKKANKDIGNISMDESINEDGGSLYDVLESNVDIEGDYIKEVEMDILKDALMSLSKKQREVIEGFYLKKMSIMEMCKHRRCHYMTIFKLKERSLKKLKEEIEKDSREC